MRGAGGGGGGDCLIFPLICDQGVSCVNLQRVVRRQKSKPSWITARTLYKDSPNALQQAQHSLIAPSLRITSPKEISGGAKGALAQRACLLARPNYRRSVFVAFDQKRGVVARCFENSSVRSKKKTLLRIFCRFSCLLREGIPLISQINDKEIVPTSAADNYQKPKDAEMHLKLLPTSLQIVQILFMSHTHVYQTL